MAGQTPQVPPATPAPAAANPTGPGNGTEVSPSFSENSGRSRTPTYSGVCNVTEDGKPCLIQVEIELACGVDSVIQSASGEFGCSYIGIHAGLELPSTQRQAYKFFKSFAEGSSGSADSQKLIQVHISLPCTGGSPLLDLSKKDRKPAQETACAMSLETSQGQPIGKVFRIACSDQVLAHRSCKEISMSMYSGPRSIESGQLLDDGEILI